MPSARSIPDNRPSPTPHLVGNDAAAAIAFSIQAFGAVQEMRLPGPGGKPMHAMLRIGGSPLMRVDAFPAMGAVGPKSLKGSPVTLHLFVPDTDATMATAAAAGGTVTMPPQDMFWGDRYGQLVDRHPPAGADARADHEQPGGAAAARRLSARTGAGPPQAGRRPSGAGAKRLGVRVKACRAHAGSSPA